MTELEKPRILVCTPAYSGVSNSYRQSMKHLEAWAHEQGVLLSDQSVANAPVDHARDSLANFFMGACIGESDEPLFTHALCIDAGIGIGVETIVKMLSFSLADASHEFVAAAPPLRQFDFDMIAKMGLEKHPKAARYGTKFGFHYTKEVRETGKAQTKGGFLAVDYVGTAVTIFRRSVFERLAAAYPELGYAQGHAYFLPTLINANGETWVGKMRAALEHINRGGGEDVAQLAEIAREALTPPENLERCHDDAALCRRWRALDTPEKPATIWLLCDAPLVHEGQYTFEGNVADALGRG
jgi:hypothetical protein